MTNRLLEHDRSVLEHSDQRDRTLHSRFPVFAEQGDDRKQNIGLPRNRAADDVESDMPPENGSCFLLASKVSVIGNAGSIRFQTEIAIRVGFRIANPIGLEIVLRTPQLAFRSIPVETCSENSSYIDLCNVAKDIRAFGYCIFKRLRARNRL
jgi:hypothetical protein